MFFFQGARRRFRHIEPERTCPWGNLLRAEGCYRQPHYYLAPRCGLFLPSASSVQGCGTLSPKSSVAYLQNYGPKASVTSHCSLSAAPAGKKPSPSDWLPPHRPGPEAPALSGHSPSLTRSVWPPSLSLQYPYIQSYAHRPSRAPSLYLSHTIPLSNATGVRDVKAPVKP